MKTALITGVSGQDGLYAVELLTEKGYRIVGTTRDIRRASAYIPSALLDRIELYQWDANSYTQLCEIMLKVMPIEIYNFAGLSSGEKMYEDPVSVGNINGMIVTKILAAIRYIDPTIKFCQASSAEMFGDVYVNPQDELTPFNPLSPYGAAKLYGHNMINIFRDRHGIFACSAVLYNHESPRRGLNFVTRKITYTAAQIKLGLANELILGNLDMRRDWLFAGDSVKAMWMMLQESKAGNYVVASGVDRSIRDFCKVAFNYLDMNYRDYVVSSPKFFRPIDSINLIGNAKKLESIGWSTTKSFEQLIHEMVDSDLELLKCS
jgi:GDPmannose 4,6-dehydratase